MKIFISHSSKNKFYGDKLVDLLRNIGVKENEIIFTSNSAYGIPVGQNIFHWLKSQITEKPFVVYLLSEEYYQSIACLNEMGAAWIIENKHAAVFTPDFNLSSKEFQSGALDPREIGFYITDEERILSFIELLSENFELTKSHIIISQSIKKLINEIKGNNKVEVAKPVVREVVKIPEKTSVQKEIIKVEPAKPIATNQNDLFSKFESLIVSGKLKDDELILVHYIIETGRFKLMTGWQEQNEIDNIKEWESINEIDNKLSRNYTSILKRFELRGFTEVSAVTSSNNPKELKIKEEISSHLLDLPDEVLSIIAESVKKSQSEYEVKTIKENDDLPF
jgi:hypothetical protein